MRVVKHKLHAQRNLRRIIKGVKSLEPKDKLNKELAARRILNSIDKYYKEDTSF